jgi:hypothetical protein
MPETGGFMVAAYVAAAVIYLGYSAYLLGKGGRKED